MIVPPLTPAFFSLENHNTGIAFAMPITRVEGVVK